MIQPSDWTVPWTADDRCMQHQAKQSEIDLEDWLDGGPHAAFDAFRTLLIDAEFEDFLETGCGCGYNREVLQSFKPRVEYMGIDISEDMIAYADERFGDDGHFITGSADKLPFVDKHFDCVCLAAVIQHVPDWMACIREAVRVSNRWIMVHRFEGTTGMTFEYKNSAYDTEIPTRIINEQQFLLFCDTAGLKLSRKVRWGRNEEGRFNASYLLELK